jgi:glucose-1-phosphate cytidylyltransferase
MNSDFTVSLKTNEVTVHSIDHEQDWDVTLAYTGEATMTGAASCA